MTEQQKVSIETVLARYSRLEAMHFQKCTKEREALNFDKAMHHDSYRRRYECREEAVETVLRILGYEINWEYDSEHDVDIPHIVEA